jgi:large subunit ribosomal protein L16
MRQFPRKKKFNKYQKGKAFNKIQAVIEKKTLKHAFGLKATESGRINFKQIKTLYSTINKQIKKNGKVLINIFPHLPISKKPIEVRMGKGKGSVNHWVFNVRPGTILCEVETKLKQLALQSLNKVKVKLPLTTKVIFKAFYLK